MSDDGTYEGGAALIADELAGPLDRDEAAELLLLAQLLAHQATWEQPRQGLGEEVVRAVTRTARPHRRRRGVAALAAVAAAIVLASGSLLVAQRGGTAGFQARLTATVLAPGARGSADVTRTRAGFRIDLDASGLLPLAPGEYYQAWLKNNAGTLVPIGTFSSSDSGVTLWSGVSP